MYDRFKGDFTGFTLGGIHSDDLNIVRISDGSRYHENLIGTFTDVTTQVPGNDESYYFRTDVTNRIFSLALAFDDMTEMQLRQLKQLLSEKKLQKLVFDENPYKYYMVKVNSVPILDYLCFEEHNHRIYKGEVAIEFIAYYPFARSVHNYIEDFKGLYSTSWERECGMKLNKKKYMIPYGKTEKEWINYYDTPLLKQIDNKLVEYMPIYNAGDTSTPFTLMILPKIGKSPNCTISLYKKSLNTLKETVYELNGQLKLTGLPINTDVESRGVYIDIRNNIIQRTYGTIITNEVLNQHITEGAFFNLPQGEYELWFTWEDEGETPTEEILNNYSLTINYNHIYY